MQMPVLWAVTRRAGLAKGTTKAEAEALVNFMSTVGQLLESAPTLKSDVFGEALTCIQIIVGRFGSMFRSKSLKIAAVISDRGFSVASRFSSTLATLAKIYEILGEAALEQAPKVLQITFDIFADAGDDGFRDARLHASCLTLITVVAKKMPLTMSGGNLGRALGAIRLSIECGFIDKHGSCRALSQALAQKVRSDDLFKVMQRDIGTLTASRNLEPAVAYIHIANDWVHRHGVGSHASSIFALILEVLKARTERAAAGIDEADIKSASRNVKIGDVEKASLALLESSIIRVNPDQFSPFFTALLEWANTAREENLDVEASITLCKVMFMLQEKLQVSFTLRSQTWIDKSSPCS
jgi:hypothetical protein